MLLSSLLSRAAADAPSDAATWNTRDAGSLQPSPSERNAGVTNEAARSRETVSTRYIIVLSFEGAM